MSIRAMKWAADVLPLVDIPPIERAALWAMAYHHSDKTGECFPSLDTLGEWSGVTSRRMQDAVKMLEAWSLIKVTRGKGARGNASNRYTLFGKPRRPKNLARPGKKPMGLERRDKLQTGTPLPVQPKAQTGTTLPVQTGTPLPVSNRNAASADRGYISNEEKGPTRLAIILGRAS